MMASHRKSIIKGVLDRLDALMAIGQSRGQAKELARATGQRTWAFSTGKIHAYKTRSTYQEHVLTFANWARTAYGIKRFEDLEARSRELASAFLQQHLTEGKSPSTVKTTRSALRLLFDDRTLADDVPIPRRSRENITRSRGRKAHDHHFQVKNWPELVSFLKATGLRRSELCQLKASHIHLDSLETGRVVVVVKRGKGGKPRTIPILAGYEHEILALKVGRTDEERVFPHIPKHLDVHAYRREFAQALYLSYAPGRSLPPAEGRLKPDDYDRVAAQRTTLALGHARIDVLTRHYLR